MTKKMIKQSLSMAWPMVGSRVLVALTNFFAMWLLSGLGPQALAASALIFVVQTSITVILSSPLFAISPITARAFGSQDHQKVGAVMQQGWLLSAFLTLLSIIVLWFAGDILLACGEDPHLVAIVSSYFHVYIWAVIPVFFFTTNQMVMMGVGKQRLALTTSLVASLALFPAAYAFTEGKWGAPNLGVQGVAIGMAISMWAGFLFSTLYCLRLSIFAHFEFFRWRLHRSWGILKQIITIGWPIMLQVGGEIFSWLLITVIIGWLGEQALAARQIVTQFNILILIPTLGLSQAASILVGQASGAKHYDKVKRLGFINIGLGAATMIMVILIYLIMPKTLISLYINPNAPENALITHWAIILFALSGFTLLFDGVRNITMGALRALYDSRYPMYVSMLFTWAIGLPMGCFLAFSAHFGLIGFAISDLVTVFIAGLLLVLRWHQRVHHLLAKAEKQDAL